MGESRVGGGTPATGTPRETPPKEKFVTTLAMVDEPFTVGRVRTGKSKSGPAVYLGFVGPEGPSFLCVMETHPMATQIHAMETKDASGKVTANSLEGQRVVIHNEGSGKGSKLALYLTVTER